MKTERKKKKAALGSGGGLKLIASNKKARHNYHIQDTFEAGIVLKGTEVKSLRAGKVGLTESFAKITKNKEVILAQMDIPHYEHGNRFNVDPLRERKLLLHRREILKIEASIKQKGLSLIPLKIYFKRGFVKVEIGTGKGKKLYDKRQDLKAKQAKRESDRVLKR